MTGTGGAWRAIESEVITSESIVARERLQGGRTREGKEIVDARSGAAA